MTYIISDLHGHYDKYIAMLQKIALKPTDTLYVLGDMIDRGPDGFKILLDMMSRSNVVPLLGNHELIAAVCLPWLLSEIADESLAALDDSQVGALSEWIANGGNTSLAELARLSRTEREELLDYIRDMDLYAEVKAQGHSFILTHAGLDNYLPDKPLDEYELEDFVFGRQIDMNEIYYYPDKTLVYGHTPTQLIPGNRRPGYIYKGGGQIDIDCGCGFGGQLGCLCLDTMEEFYV